LLGMKGPKVTKGYCTKGASGAKFFNDSGL